MIFLTGKLSWNGNQLQNFESGPIISFIMYLDHIFSQLTTSYFINSDNDFELNCQAARLLVDIMSGMEGKIFEDWVSHQSLKIFHVS